MNRQKWILMGFALALIAGAAGLLAQMRTHQRLGAPGVRTERTADPARLNVLLPERVLDYQSELLEVDEITLATLPDDTSFGQRRYKAPDGFVTLLNVVLMGRDRTSLHKPQFCLAGQGWSIDGLASAEDRIGMEKPIRYELPVVKLVATKPFEEGGQRQVARAVYVYWYVADGALSASTSGFQRMWQMARHLLTRGEMQRWAYVTCMSVCAPGQEDATYQRMKAFIAAAVPDFQLTPAASAANAGAVLSGGPGSAGDQEKPGKIF